MDKLGEYLFYFLFFLKLQVLLIRLIAVLYFGTRGELVHYFPDTEVFLRGKIRLPICHTFGENGYRA